MFGKHKIADKINTDEIKFERKLHIRNDKALVSLAKTQGTLLFNPKMVKLLDMGKWENVVVGYHAQHNVIALKLCEDAEEVGTVAVRPPYRTKREMTKQSTKERTENCREVCIKHVIHLMNGACVARYWRAERSGVMILLEPVEEKI